jgi:polyphosphate glucokinase
MRDCVKVLVVDVGGTSVKVLATAQPMRRKFASGSKMKPAHMVDGVKELTADWTYDVISLGFPGVVRQNRVVTEPINLAAGWMGFDFASAFGRPVKLINDAAMQALGHYRGGSMLFLGLGTGLGSAMVVDGLVVPLEFGQLPYKRGTYEDYLGTRGLKRLGRKKWEKKVLSGASEFIAATNPDDVVIGGGNAKHLKQLPDGCRIGDNANAFLGGFRLWEPYQAIKGED